MGHSNGRMEEKKTKKTVDCGSYLRTLQRGRRILVGTGLETIQVTFWWRIGLHPAHVLQTCKLKLKSNGLMLLMKKLSKKGNTDAAPWLLLPAFSHIYSEREQVEQKGRKMEQKERKMYSVGCKGGKGDKVGKGIWGILEKLKGEGSLVWSKCFVYIYEMIKGETK